MNLFSLKVQRKLLKYYYRQKYPVVSRRQLNLNQILEEIKQEQVPSFYTGKNPYFILSFDDASLLDGSEGTIDCGGNERGQTNEFFFSLMRESPLIKSSLYFVPFPQYYFYSDFSKLHQNKKFSIEHNLHPFVQRLNDWEKKERVEVCAHGLHHVRRYPFHYYSAFEYDFIHEEEIEQSILKSFELCSSRFEIKGFKPPAWSVGQLDDSYRLLKILKKTGLFSFYNLSTPTNGLNYKEKRVSHIYPSFYNGLLNIPQNISILWDEQIIYQFIDLIGEKNGIINLQLHYSPAHSELKDGFSNEIMEKLKKIIKYIQQKKVESKFNYEIARLCESAHE